MPCRLSLDEHKEKQGVMQSERIYKRMSLRVFRDGKLVTVGFGVEQVFEGVEDDLATWKTLANHLMNTD